MNRIAGAFVLFATSILFVGCTVAPVRYVAVQPTQMQNIKICDQSGWQCQNVAMAVVPNATQTLIPPVVYVQPPPLYYYDPLFEFAAGIIIGGSIWHHNRRY